jgi:type II secretory pathway pseudopilin PulG
MKSSRAQGGGGRGGSAPPRRGSNGTTKASTTEMRMAKTDDEEVELSTSSQETSLSSPRDNPADSEEEGSSSTSSCARTTLSQESRARKRRRCFTILVGIVFAAGVALVVLSVTFFHKQGQQHNANQQTQQQQQSSSSTPPDEQQPSPTSPENSIDRNDANATTTGNNQDDRGGYQEQGNVRPPSRFPTLPPSMYPSFDPTGFPTFGPTVGATVVPTAQYAATTATFYAIGDVPYDDKQASQLTVQMQNIPSSADFVIHVGDIRNASDSMTCRLEEFEKASSIFRLSPVPVFVIMGDNDWNDCPNSDEGLQYWQKEFLYFESRYWNHTFNITRMPGRDESFTFRFRETLFIGLNLVGGKVLNQAEWKFRLTSQFNWTADLIREYRDDVYPNTGRVVLFGHCNPTSHHAAFFNPLKDFVEDELGDTLPLLYLNGDQHKWKYEDNYLSQEYMLRIMVTGGSSEPPLKVTVNANGFLRPTDESFLYDRDLTNTSLWMQLPA